MAGTGRYRRLDADKIAVTLTAVGERIHARFPGAGLFNVCVELTEITTKSHATLAAVQRVDPWLRVGSVAVALVGILLLLLIVPKMKWQPDDGFGFLQGLDAAKNIAIAVGALGLFLATLQTRRSRQRALDGLHEIRSIVHVIDMHQLTKDPTWTLTATTVPRAGKEPRRMTLDDLEAYLDFCSELLSLSAKVAALYAQSTRDAVVIEVVSDIERLTASLSQKVWQKIIIVQQLRAVRHKAGPEIG